MRRPQRIYPLFLFLVWALTFFRSTQVDCFVSPISVSHSRKYLPISRHKRQDSVRLYDNQLDEFLLTRAETIGKSISLFLAFAISFRIGAALSVIGQPRLPPLPEGSSPVGSKVVRLPSGTRVRLSHPCRPNANKEGDRDAAYCTDGRATSDGMAGLVGFRQLGLSFLLGHLADASSGCFAEAVMAGGDGDIFPLLVYSHGYGGNMDMGAYFLRAMACKGIVVAALEHTDGTASSTLLEDGSRLDFSPSLLSSRDGLSLRATEMIEAAKYLPSIFSNLDPSQILLGGHSYGAPSALLASQQTSSSTTIKGLILHDPALGMGYGMLQLPPRISTVSYTSDEYNRGGVKCGDVTLHVQGAFHGNFVDAPLWAPLWVMRPLSILIPACGPADPIQIHEELAESAKDFTNLVIATSKTKAIISMDWERVVAGSLFERIN